MNAQKALDFAQAQGALMVTGAIYAELLALPGRTKTMLDAGPVGNGTFPPHSGRFFNGAQASAIVIA